MASSIPAPLKSADISRYATRAAQLEAVKPPIAYWCYYWMVNRILAKGLHTADEECTTYTTDLMDKLEQMKSQYATNDAIHDDLAGQAYVEQFGLETFTRADNAVRANKASRQTAETFQAAATFLELVNIWGDPNQEITAKIKYAKYHALRIAKALKAGEDPNLSNPEAEPPLPQENVTLDPNDPEVQEITGSSRQATVQDVADEDAGVVSPLAPPGQQDQDDDPYALLPSAANHDPGKPPLPSESIPTPTANSRQGSFGGGYFPIAQDDLDTTAPDPDIVTPISPPSAALPSPDNPQDFYTSPPPAASAPTIAPSIPSKATIPPHAQPRAALTPAARKPAAAPTPTPLAQDGPFITDDDAIFAAQRHAKFAISALNFEDVPTAVKELRAALQSLGGR